MSDFIGKLCPQSCRPIRLGGANSLTAADIAQACSNLNEMGYLIICIKYGGDNSGFAALQKSLSKRIYIEAQKEGWKKSRLPCLIKLAVVEYCSGQTLKDEDKGKAIGVCRTTWARTWRGKYNRLIEILEAYEAGALHTIKNRIK